MGRAERRREERRRRKNRPNLSVKDVQKLQEETIDRMADMDAEIMLSCFALALNEEYGWGKTRILRALTATDEIFGRIARHELTLPEMRELVGKKTGIRISV